MKENILMNCKMNKGNIKENNYSLQNLNT